MIEVAETGAGSVGEVRCGMKAGKEIYSVGLGLSVEVRDGLATEVELERVSERVLIGVGRVGAGVG